MLPTNDDANVVARLKQRLAEVRKLGFKVRVEMLDDPQASWCEIAGIPTLFVDLSQTAAEQLQQVNETIREWESTRSTKVHALEQVENRESTEKQAA
ncbi:MAG: hypothetical protein AB8B91_20015 [Rubripirellula sp.]